jgi:hypothetical protein
MKEPAVPNVPPPSGEGTIIELPTWFRGVFHRMGELDDEIKRLERHRARLRTEFGHLSMEVGCYVANQLPEESIYFPQSWVKRGPTTVEVVPPPRHRGGTGPLGCRLTGKDRGATGYRDTIHLDKAKDTGGLK